MINKILDDLIQEAREYPDWKAVSALRCAKKELLKEIDFCGKWISVKDRLPEEYGNYLAVVDGEVTECTYSGPFVKGIITGWSTCEANGLKWLHDEHVTCWMPLPEPPKEG